MAKETVTIDRAAWEQMLADVAELKRTRAAEAEKADGLHPKQVYDEAWAAREKDVCRPPAVRTQEIADRTYGVKGPRWRVALDGTRQSGKAINLSEHPTLVISANSPEEAEGRYARLCGIRGFLDSDVKYRTERAESARPQPQAEPEPEPAAA